MVSALLERCKSAGVNVHAQSRDGANTLAHQAARRDDPGLLALLLRAGLDPNTPNGAGSVPALGDGTAGSRAAGQRVSGLMDWRSLLDRSTPLTAGYQRLWADRQGRTAGPAARVAGTVPAPRTVLAS